MKRKTKKEIDEMDWNKQIEKLEDELKKLIEKENRLTERKKEVEEKLRKAKEQKENEENKQLAEIVTEYLGPMDAKKIEDLKTVLDMYMSEFTEEKESEEESIKRRMTPKQKQKREKKQTLLHIYGSVFFYRTMILSA